MMPNKPQMYSIIIVILLALGCTKKITLEGYQPKSNEEAAVKNSLIHFVESINKRDSDKLSAIIHDDARLRGEKDVFGYREEITKTGYVAYILQKAKNDYFEIECASPEIYIDKNRAFVKVLWKERYPLDFRNSEAQIIFRMINENNEWLILGQE
jgi:hypothetical protein